MARWRPARRASCAGWRPGGRAGEATRTRSRTSAPTRPRSAARTAAAGLILAVTMVAGTAALPTPAGAPAALRPDAPAAPRPGGVTAGPLTATQDGDLASIAAATWSFVVADIDPATNLPRDGIAND